ncbi:DUF333 domain-containing protein [Pseudomonas sp. SGAir0191]|uniref:putative hemolysin n=1 Tax=Pseudomonas putida group TaxID=136845 RepID=UPI000C2C28FA|nr:DUF333 domain-containing protein [Pseudomonas sp. SGAir0191]AUA33329.1 DUF333 domain-containing protein [Pseudomonas sp. SGAir0191]
MKMKTVLASSALIGTVLAGCSTTHPGGVNDEENIGMANPASVFCAKQGGQPSTEKDADGNEIGICTLQNGKIMDEWEYYRMNSN